jgi:4-hydroxybenzoate polyprenyltransferase
METELRDSPCPRLRVSATAVSSGTRARRTKSRSGWLELIRPPNLFTVPGDVLAGAALAGFEAPQLPLLLAAIPISLLLYLSGLILNDYTDRHRDARERPSRPIPSGRVDARSAGSVALLLLTTAVLLSRLAGSQVRLTALVLAVLILAYNGPARRVPPVGFVVMGLCRGGNICVGAAAVDRLAAVPVAVGAALAGGNTRRSSLPCAGQACPCGTGFSNAGTNLGPWPSITDWKNSAGIWAAP